jgi:hypothetical protein
MNRTLDALSRCNSYRTTHEPDDDHFWSKHVAQQQKNTWKTVQIRVCRSGCDNDIKSQQLDKATGPCMTRTSVVRQDSHDMYPGRIERCGPVIWPLRQPDLNRAVENSK